MKILVIDNYDSFTYNLVQLIASFNCKVIVKLNDHIDVAMVGSIKPDKIVISPGPGRPENSLASIDVIKKFHLDIPILGVCLGHQAIAVCFGGKVVTAPTPVHGKTSGVKHFNYSVFKNLPQNFKVMRYHSLIVEKKSLPEVFQITAESDEGVIMGIEHKTHPLTGVQFHPESILTEYGNKMIENWLAE